METLTLDGTPALEYTMGALQKPQAEGRGIWDTSDFLQYFIAPQLSSLVGQFV